MFGGLIPDASQLTKKAVMLAVTVPEGAVMVCIAFLLDGAGMFLFVLSLAGVGIPLTWLLNVVGMFTIGLWTVTRSFFRGVVEKMAENISEKILSVGGGLEGEKTLKGTPPPGLETGKKVAKTGVKLSVSAMRFIISSGLKMIPFVGNLYPGWTIMVIFELIQGEI